MSDEPDFADKLPTADEIEEGRKGSLMLGILIGGAVVATGIIAYLLFGKYLVI